MTDCKRNASAYAKAWLIRGRGSLLREGVRVLRANEGRRLKGTLRLRRSVKVKAKYDLVALFIACWL